MKEKDEKDDNRLRDAEAEPRVGIEPRAVTTNTTTLAAAVTVTDDRIKLVSGATVAKGQFAVIAKECMQILDQVSSTDTTLWLVSRGVSGTPCLAHNAAANVKTGPAHHFLMFDPAGAADVAKVVAVPAINVLNGNAFDVSAGAWRQVGTGGVLQGTAVWP